MNVCKLFVLYRNTLHHITVYKQIIRVDTKYELKKKIMYELKKIVAKLALLCFVCLWHSNLRRLFKAKPF